MKASNCRISEDVRDNIDAIASRWVVRRRAGLDGADERELEQWLMADSAHREAFQRLTAMSDVLVRAEAKGATNIILSQLTIRAKKRRKRRAYGAAACALALLLAVALPWTSKDEAPTAVAQNFEPTRRLPDGSIVEIKQGAELKVQFGPAIRRVELVRGEAFFQVESDPSRPFVVRAGGVDVRAVGTAFNIQITTASIEVLVTAGKVGLADTKGESLLPRFHNGEVPVLIAGQKATIGPALSVRIAQVGAEDLQQLTWRMLRLEFDGVELGKAVEQFNRYNRRQIVLDGEAVRTSQISGAFLTNDPETFARLVAASLGLEIERRGENSIVLRKK